MECVPCGQTFTIDSLYSIHISSKNHAITMRAYNAKKAVAERSIVVYPKKQFMHHPDLVELFRDVGTIKHHKFHKNELNIEFTSPQSVKDALSKPFYYQNIKLCVKERHFKFVPKPIKKKVLNQISASELTRVLVVGDCSVETQLQAFLREVQIDQLELNNLYQRTTDELFAYFKKSFPKCLLYRFGSSVTGLCLKESDLDLYLDIGENKEHSKAWVQAVTLKRVKATMYQAKNLFGSVVPIPKAKTPIIKFCYLPTKVNCDITFKNALGVYNSKFLKDCFDLHESLRPVMLYLKYWAKRFDLTGMGRMTNYSLVLLFIFYLQQPTIKLLPPLTHLQNDDSLKIINGWRVDFDFKRLEPLDDVSDKLTPSKLLHGFFDFYGKFDFYEKLICPLEGVSYDVKIFCPEEMPASMSRYFANITDDHITRIRLDKPMCVQDPIELCHNVTGNVPPRILDTFQKQAILAASICDDAKDTGYIDIISDMLEDAVTRRRPVRRIVIANYEQYKEVGLPNDFDKRENIVDKRKYMIENWFLTVCNVLKEIFVKVLRFDVVIMSDQGIKQQKTKKPSDVHSKDHDKIRLVCIGNTRILWTNRKEHDVSPKPNLSCVDYEALVTNKILEKQKGTSKEHVEFECLLEKKHSPKIKIDIFLTDRTVHNYCIEFHKFFREEIKQMVNKQLSYMLGLKRNV